MSDCLKYYKIFLIQNKNLVILIFNNLIFNNTMLFKHLSHILMSPT